MRFIIVDTKDTYLEFIAEYSSLYMLITHLPFSKETFSELCIYIYIYIPRPKTVIYRDFIYKKGDVTFILLIHNINTRCHYRECKHPASCSQNTLPV